VGKREENKAKRGRKKMVKEEEAEGREGEIDGESIPHFLFHQSLPPLEYKTHLHRLITKP
jgi:hypothetical protein